MPGSQARVGIFFTVELFQAGLKGYQARRQASRDVLHQGAIPGQELQPELGDVGHTYWA